MKIYKRAEKYDPKWITNNWMGPNPIWLLEELCEHLDLKPGMKVLDMGCGKGLTSVFLAKEFGVMVFANDLWISATDNLKRFEEAGADDLVYPIHAEAHSLPYADGFFDAAISIDSYHYYGAGESYFPEVFSKLVKQGGQFGIVVPGLVKEFEKGYPDTLKNHWVPEMFTFHSKDWWRHLWEKTELVEIAVCYDMADLKKIWMPFAEWSRVHMAWQKEEIGFDDVDFLEADVNNDIALIVMAALKK